jgi:hypothetical protein
LFFLTRRLETKKNMVVDVSEMYVHFVCRRIF